MTKTRYRTQIPREAGTISDSYTLQKKDDCKRQSLSQLLCFQVLAGLKPKSGLTLERSLLEVCLFLKELQFSCLRKDQRPLPFPSALPAQTAAPEAPESPSVHHSVPPVPQNAPVLCVTFLVPGLDSISKCWLVLLASTNVHGRRSWHNWKIIWEVHGVSMGITAALVSGKNHLWIGAHLWLSSGSSIWLQLSTQR